MQYDDIKINQIPEEYTDRDIINNYNGGRK